MVSYFKGWCRPARRVRSVAQYALSNLVKWTSHLRSFKTLCQRRKVFGLVHTSRCQHPSTNLVTLAVSTQLVSVNCFRYHLASKRFVQLPYSSHILGSLPFPLHVKFLLQYTWRLLWAAKLNGTKRCLASLAKKNWRALHSWAPSFAQ